MSKFKPLLAYSQNPDIHALAYPMLASPKLDGFRVVVRDGKALTRSLKPLPNKFTREWLEANAQGFDGELLVRNGTFNDCQSAFMSQDGEPDFEYHVFDLLPDETQLGNIPFIKRYDDLCNVVKTLAPRIQDRVKLVPHVLVHSAEELSNYEEWATKEGFEGVMLRALSGVYKCGRSTLREAILLKLKRWVDSEGVIIGFEEQLTNTNEKTTNELGHSERSTHKAGMVPAGTLGKFLARDIATGEEIAVGSGLGLTKALRQEIWDNRDKYMGRIISYKYQPSGMKDAPRFPIWKGFRHVEDMGE